ncbi:MAG: ATP-binding cassette domain-containing protein [Deltaproteobacteria bacterium]|nr:ATP-binding cassette domain-containing protein [Deltaproteobacteria bacterium]
MMAPRSEKSPFLTLDGISLRLQDRVVFENTCWRILLGERWAVMGPNGSGKSTLMKALCGRVPVVKGRIHHHFLEKPPSGAPSRATGSIRDSVAYVSFEPLKARLTGGPGFHQVRWNSLGLEDSPQVQEVLSRNSLFGPLPFEVLDNRPDPAAIAAKTEEVVALLGIENLLAKRVVALSDGERRKVALAAALIRNPRLLILENPFTGLDAAYRTKLQRIIGKIMETGTVVIVSITRPSEAFDLITHVVLVENERIVGQGPKEEILGRAFSTEATYVREKASAGPVPPSQGGENVGEGDVRRPTLVEMYDVHVMYDGTPILMGINWTIRRGEHWALLGPNGAGKTTLLSLILGDNPQAYANRIVLFGKPRGSGETIWDLKRRMGWVSPELHLHYPRRFSCLDAVCSGFFDSMGLYRGVPADRHESAASLMRELGLEEIQGRRFGAVSQGEQRMVLLARALVKQPLLLILDEPCQGLDPNHRRRILQTVDALGRRQQASIIYVTHEPEELPPVINHAIQLDRGTIVRKGRWPRC